MELVGGLEENEGGKGTSMVLGGKAGGGGSYR